MAMTTKYPPDMSGGAEKNRWENIRAVNDEIQEFISTKGETVPTELIKQLSALDWLLREGQGRE